MLILLSILTLVLAGFVKGAIGSGVPLIVVPIFTVLYDIQTAIVVLLVPNLLSNMLQVWRYRRHLLPLRFLIWFAVAGGVGVLLGTWALVSINEKLLSITVAVTMLAYLGLRVLRRDAELGHALANKLVIPAGLCGGVLQGAVGMSAPVSVAFLNFMRLERRVFIGSISTFFAAITVVQLPALLSVGLVTWPLAMASVAAFLVIWLAMPLGGRLGQYLARDVIDKVIMALLFLIAMRILLDALISSVNG
ncbi:sulfite exporter TauE/SafE family protein [Franzmannia qiaohouensis]|uniref:Probable membrane transporter protein n=1 Tax=Franzmannia qiaohouensis TaxID=1329370 RepID=A0ABU1H8T7_9GAMM|nr:sulfite exporter TauE/SafE family protein [Halomonas qiaohouensis]MDR5903702.1 sulfite exporter TauE/SafE family protein [Halomonas qiaohouensis]